MHGPSRQRDFKHNMVSKAPVDGSCVEYCVILEGRMLDKSTMEKTDSAGRRLIRNKELCRSEESS